VAQPLACERESGKAHLTEPKMRVDSRTVVHRMASPVRELPNPIDNIDAKPRIRALPKIQRPRLHKVILVKLSLRCHRREDSKSWERSIR
jgi:hypothetical protein